MKKYLLAALLVPAPIFALAQASASGLKYHDLPNGQRIIVPASSPLRSVGEQIWGAAMSTTAGGMPQVGATGQLPNPSNGRVPAVAVGTLPPAQVGAAVARFASKVVTPLAIGMALFDLAKELGFTLDNSSGVIVTTKADPDACLTNCYTWQFNQGVPGADPAFYPSSQLACEKSWPAFINYFGGRLTGSPTGIYDAGGTVAQCKGVLDGQFRVVTTHVRGPSRSPDSGTGTPSTLQEFIDAVSAKSGWPAASKVNDVIRNDPNPELQTPTGITVTGPATSPGPVSTTTTNNTDSSTNTTTNSTTTYNHTYAGDTITTTNTTVSITTNNAGAVTSTTTNSSTPPPVAAPAPAPPPPTKVCGLPDTPACKIDETGTAPNAGTIYDASKTAIDTAKTSAETNIGGAASIGAPSWSFAFQLPTGCAPYVTGIKGVVLNVCQYQSTIHGLLSVIWAAATAFAMIGMVGRTIRES